MASRDRPTKRKPDAVPPQKSQKKKRASHASQAWETKNVKEPEGGWPPLPDDPTQSYVTVGDDRFPVASVAGGGILSGKGNPLEGSQTLDCDVKLVLFTADHANVPVLRRSLSAETKQEVVDFLHRVICDIQASKLV